MWFYKNSLIALLIKLLRQVILLVLTVTIDYKILLMMILFITSWCKALKTEPSREICIYATRLKPSFCQIITLIDLYISATALLENSYYYGVILENKRLFLISYLATPRSTLNLNYLLNKKKLYAYRDCKVN